MIEQYPYGFAIRSRLTLGTTVGKLNNFYFRGWTYLFAIIFVRRKREPHRIPTVFRWLEARQFSKEINWFHILIMRLTVSLLVATLVAFWFTPLSILTAP